jgi:cytochrome c556
LFGEFAARLPASFTPGGSHPAIRHRRQGLPATLDRKVVTIMLLRSRLIGLSIALAVVTGTGGLAFADDPSPADIIKTRQKNLKELGASVKAIMDQLKTGMPDKTVTVPAAEKIAALAKDLPTWFPKGTGPEAGVKTAAKPEIWEKPDEF